jgi:hypothetical protein
MPRVTKKDAKIALDEKIRKYKDMFNNGEYEELIIESDHGSNNANDDVIRLLTANIIRINHSLGLPHMKKDEVDEYLKQLGEGFFDDVWSGVKTIGKTALSIARPFVAPVGNMIGQRYGIPVPVGTIADEGLKVMGMGTRQRYGNSVRSAGYVRSAGKIRSAGQLENRSVRSAQRMMTPDDYN